MTQASLTISLGYPRPDDLPVTLTDIMKKVISDEPIELGEGILHHEEGIDLMPANIELSGLEVSLVNTISRETVLKQYLQLLRKEYDFILIDCSPSLGMLTVNAMAASDNLIVPVQASYLSAKGLELLLQTVSQVRRQINPRLRIGGILLTMVEARTNDAKEISSWSGFSKEGREDDYTWGITYAVDTQCILLRGDSDINTIADLQDKVVGVIPYTPAYDKLMISQVYDSGALREVKEYEDINESVIDFKEGKIDAIVIDEVAGQAIIDNNP